MTGMLRRNWIRKLPSYQLYGLGPMDRRQVMPYGLTAVIVGAAFALRWIFDPMLPSGFPFVTFLPAIVISAFALGLWPSILASAAGLLLSWYYFIPPVYSFALQSSTIAVLAFFLFIVVVNVLLTHLAIGAIHDSDDATRAKDDLAAFQEILIRELDHRIKNTFTVVASLVKLSARYASSTSDLADEVSARILALGRSHSSLWRVDRDADATVQSIARQVLEPFLTAHAGKITITGQSPVLDVRRVQMLSLIFHELATNAVKYGALANDEGQVQISSLEDGPQTICVLWKESGTARTETEAADGSRKGYGTELIERLISGAGGQLTRLFDDGKMTMTIQFSGT